MELIKTGKEIEKIYVQRGEREGSITKIVAMARNKGIVVEETDKKRLDYLSNGIPHQGIAALSCPVEYCSVEDILEEAKIRNEKPLIVVCDEIEDPHNLGAIIRSADGAGAHGVIIGKRRNAPITQTVVKSSAGAVSYIKIAKVSNIASVLDELKEKGLWIFAADMTGTDYKKVNFDCGCVLVVGNEGSGISRLVKDKCDELVSIPMRGGVESLNVSVATAIILYEMSSKQK
jgi:23S rRNA (guanosine2251-2'-O)-methyltransferase